MDVGGTVQDSFPEGDGIFYEGDPGEKDGYILGKNDGGVIRYGEIWEDGSVWEIDDKRIFMIYPMYQNYGDVYTRSDTIAYTPSATIDSTISFDTFTYIGYGTMRMYYGDISDIVLYRQNKKTARTSINATTGQIEWELTDFVSSYLFMQNGNLMPLLYYSFDTYPNWTPQDEKTNLVVYIPFADIMTNTEPATTLPINSFLSPNPASDKVFVHFVLQEPTPVNLSLLNADGQLLAEITTVHHSAGMQTEEFRLPKELLSGVYYLKITAGTKTGIEKIIVQR